MLSPKAFVGKRYFVVLKPLLEMTFVILSIGGGGGLMKTNLSFLYMSFSVGGGEGLN